MQWRLVRSELGTVRQPVRLFLTATGHTVEPVNSRTVLEGVGSADVTEIVLPHSLRPDRLLIAIRGQDAPTSFIGSVEFIHGIHQERVKELA